MAMKLLGILAAGLIAATAMTASAQAGERRIALLIGNEAYPPEVGQLSLPHEDVEAIQTSLETVGFTVMTGLDLDEDGMEDAIADFENALNEAAEAGDEVVAFFYYSGHGASAIIDGERQNFLLPAHESITNASQLARRGIEEAELVTGLALTGASSVFVVVDACRNDLAAAFDRSGVKGFTPTRARPGMFLQHSTSAGATAPDDGLFAKTLARYITEPGLEVGRAFQLVNREVAETRGIQQLPTASNALFDDFCFNGCEANQMLVADEAAALGQALASDSIAMLREFEARFPTSPSVALVKGRMAELSGDGVRDVMLTIKRIECLLADDEGPFNEVDMSVMTVTARSMAGGESGETLELYRWTGDESKGFNTGDVLEVNRSVPFRFDPKGAGVITMSAEFVDNDPTSENETGGFTDRAFPVDRFGLEQSFNVNSSDFSFKVVYQFDEA